MSQLQNNRNLYKLKISSMVYGDNLGRIKTKLIKRVTKDLIKEHGEKLKDNFEENKKIIDGLAEISSKKVRNAIAGYVTKSIKAQKE
ncbi:MAG: 30S ribosomal protein S17e [Nanoarchaeota archaeon]